MKRKIVWLSSCLMILFVNTGCGSITQTNSIVQPIATNSSAQSSSATVVESVDSLIGKPLNNSEVNSFLNNLRSRPKKSERFNDEFYYSYKDDGIELICDKGDRITTVFLYAGDQRQKRYQGVLPQGLSFSDTREDVIRKLKTPSKSGDYEGQAWSKYYFPAYSLHVQYGEDKTITQLTVMTPNSDPN